MSNREFNFRVDPTEDGEARDLRWDKELAELQSQGLTIQGVGPDSDYPIRYDFAADGSMTFDEWWKGNPDTPWFEVYNLVPLEEWNTSGYAFVADPEFVEALKVNEEAQSA